VNILCNNCKVRTLTPVQKLKNIEGRWLYVINRLSKYIQLNRRLTNEKLLRSSVMDMQIA